MKTRNAVEIKDGFNINNVYMWRKYANSEMRNVQIIKEISVMTDLDKIAGSWHENDQRMKWLAQG